MTTWTYDPSHYPEPMTPLSADVWFDAMGRGIRAAARELRAPFGGFETMTTDGGWAYEHEVRLFFIDPGKPMQNGSIESFNGRFREECLDPSWFTSLAEARRIIEAWRLDYNVHRPHTSLRMATPAAFAAARPFIKQPRPPGSEPDTTPPPDIVAALSVPVLSTTSGFS